MVEPDAPGAGQGLDLEASTGGFMRLYTGLSNVTSPATTGGTRRETLAYDSYLDLLSLFHHNGSVKVVWVVDPEIGSATIGIENDGSAGGIATDKVISGLIGDSDAAILIRQE